jgi:hypothetical protein
LPSFIEPPLCVTPDPGAPHPTGGRPPGGRFTPLEDEEVVDSASRGVSNAAVRTRLYAACRMEPCVGQHVVRLVPSHHACSCARVFVFGS